ncbi:Fatty acid desaturase [Gimesia chilikensis]|uniref:Fatty acid desaturase n=1 Tax=Gimesia chilikensis TaxID=2605989 RepID=A0A517WCR7_9PLAN|nr:fatty acid desaturase [Gimesia chilikensis]QDU03046.1 Fatty acid desaturase [Gimesia chilikensis]
MASVILEQPPENQSTVTAQPKKSKKREEREQIISRFHKENLKWSNVDWVILLWMAGIHIGAVAAFFFISWQAVVTCLVLHWATASIGICLGYHRYLSHKSMKLRAPAEFFVLLCGVLSGEGSPLTWAATHRLHHQKSDKQGDPHSPFEGTFWSHLLWLFVYRSKEVNQKFFEHYVPDMKDRKMLQFFEKTYGLWVVGSGFVLFGIGYAMGGMYMAWSMLLWGLCARMAFVYNSTWFVNSATHLWGYRNYETTDQSKNLWWVAIVAYGEGWHNNHHAHPSVAPAGHRKWEFDITWWSIKALRAIGQAYDVNDRIPQKNAEPEIDPEPGKNGIVVTK